MDLEAQENELLALQSIFDSREFVRQESKSAGEIRVSVELPPGYLVALREGDTLKQYDTSFLPSLLLTFGLPENYPSSSPPSFTLYCSWLTHKQLAALGAHLTDLYRATGGDVVLFTWVQFLREDALRFLKISSVLQLSNEPSTPYNSRETIDVAPSEQKTQPTLTSGSKDGIHEWTNSSNVDTRGSAAADDFASSRGDDETCGTGARDKTRDTSDEYRPFSGPTLTPAESLLSEIMIHDAARRQKVFQSTVYDCAVCFMSYLGSECVQILECGHIFCQACLAEFCKLQITEGNVRGVTCAQAGCTALPTQAQLESLVGEELFRRYDRLLLQSTLDRMADVMYCPRPSCASPVVLEEGSGVALCSVCGFAFCVTCKKTYHGTDRCRPTVQPKSQENNDPEQGNADLPQSLEGMKALWDDYASGSKERKRLLESQYGRNGLFLTLEHCLSDDWIVLNSKNCPSCFCRIQVQYISLLVCSFVSKKRLCNSSMYSVFQKTHGCNMMSCSQCRLLFCWACLTGLSPKNASQHFQDSGCSRY
ncbi:E3 ubiquitin-protein ligase RNF14-like isoform X1 [Phyllopteryx taeniolatus]|uniref:E3 ubiquitin-protein ligase RNF14-like isoform X1 n=1 Tax=Phyllopteryx taeniolatus TaxID=161469 RepID=UPI002AD59382|nr:E3 ubiquitin-protein ligase RNF14-like isoform X1 [Phyllopteryx taeniolatus]